MDDVQPFSDLLLTGKEALIGTTSGGGVAGAGNVFALSPGASGAWNLNVLYGFTGPDGPNPSAGLIASGGALYGTTSNGGTVGFGTVFQLK
ncbi:MAG: choice-of-anchor tandem repeat GloVer-containing protein [Bryobacteraceae bacterium]